MDLDMDAVRAGTRFAGAAPGGMVRAVVDHAGRLVDLHLDPDLLRQPAVAVQRATIAAVAEAQRIAEAHDGQHDRAAREALARQVAADVERAGFAAERGLGELNTLVSDLLRTLRPGASTAWAVT
jgi:DNA-binding protein YbaB